MKWKFLFVLIIGLFSISVIGCWPFVPPPPPPPPSPMHLFEDHYLRFQAPYDRGLTHMASQQSGEAVHPINSHHMNQHLFYPLSSMNPIPPISYAEPQERLYEEPPNFDFGSTREFVGYAPREPHLMKVRHMNYRYRKRLKTHRPIEENHEGFGHHKEVKYSQSYNNPQPRRYNVIDSRGEYQKRIPNSVNDKLEPNLKKVLTEEESNQNLSANKTDKNERKSEPKAQDLQQISSQNKDFENSIKPTVDMPIEVTSYALKSPDGAVTQVTEMLYDVENNPFKVSTATPVVTPYWRPSTPFLRPVIEESFVTQTPYMKSAFSEIETGPTVNVQPINTAVTAKFNDITMSPVLSITTQRNTMEPMPTVFTIEPTLPPTPPRLRTSSSPSDYYTRRARKRLSTQKPYSTTPKNSARESKPGLSGAAIAGIVIGSMVSIVLLAGTSLFVLYKNPFRRALNTQRSGDSLPNVRSNDPNTVQRVHRWQPRRQRRL